MIPPQRESDFFFFFFWRPSEGWASASGPPIGSPLCALMAELCEQLGPRLMGLFFTNCHLLPPPQENMAILQIFLAACHSQ